MGIEKENEAPASTTTFAHASLSREELDEIDDDPEANDDDSSSWNGLVVNPRDNEFSVVATTSRRMMTKSFSATNRSSPHTSSPTPPDHRDVPQVSQLFGPVKKRIRGSNQDDSDAQSGSAKRVRTTSSPERNEAERPRSKNSPAGQADSSEEDDQVEDYSEDTAQSTTEPQIGNQVSKTKGHRARKPTEAEFKDALCYSVLKRAITRYQLRIVLQNAVPSGVDKNTWALQEFAAAGEELDDHDHVLSRRMRRLITSRDSIARTHIRAAVLSTFQGAYGFKDGISDDIIIHNKALAQKLGNDSGFIFIDPDNDRGAFQHHIVQKVINQVYFRHKNDVGIRYSVTFNPMPLGILTLIFAIVKTVVDAWTSGTKRTVAEFKAKTHEEDYNCLYTAMETYLDKGNAQSARFARYLHELFDNGMIHAGIVPEGRASKTALSHSRLEAALAANDGELSTNDSSEV